MTTIPDAQAKNIRATLAAISDIVDPPVIVTPPPAPPVMTPPVVTPAPAPVPVPSHFALTVDDEFSGATLDPKTWWPAYNGVKGTGGVGTRKGSLCTLVNGQLVLAGERPDANNTDYNSWFSTGVAMGTVAHVYGRWEVRAKASRATGFWPNLQLWPTAGKQGVGTSDGWPDTIEFDIMEAPSTDRSQAVTTLHYAGNKTTSFKKTLDVTQFHVYVVEWTPDALVVLIDDIEVGRIIDKTLIPSKPHHLVAQTDMGAWAGKPTPQDPTRMELVLDYVKHFKFTG